MLVVLVVLRGVVGTGGGMRCLPRVMFTPRPSEGAGTGDVRPPTRLPGAQRDPMRAPTLGDRGRQPPDAEGTDRALAQWWEQERGCATRGCCGTVDAGVKHVRCDSCRRVHQLGKDADAAWDRRARRRDKADERRDRAGLASYPDQQAQRARVRTPNWDRHGNETDATPRLTAAQARSLRVALDNLELQVRLVRRALGPG